MAHAQSSAARFAHQSKRRNQRGIERILATLFEIRIFQRNVAKPSLHLGLELHGFFQKFGVGQLLKFRGERIDRA